MPTQSRNRNQPDAPIEIARPGSHWLKALSNAHIPWTVLIAWLLLYGTRPFRLGFYGDDWWSLERAVFLGGPLSPARLRCFFSATAAYAGRPVDAILMFFVSLIGSTSAVIYQIIAIIFVLLAALSLRAWFLSMLSNSDLESPNIAADVATVFWLSIPWSVAITSWPVLAPAAMLSQLCLTEACRRIVRPVEISPRVLGMFSLWIIASLLTYEVFYFQCLVVIAVYFGCIWDRRSKYATVIRAFTVALGCHALTIAVNRLNSGAHGAKHLVPNWLLLLARNLKSLPAQFRYAVGDLASWYGCAMLICGSALVLVFALHLRSARHARRLLGLFLLGVGAVPVSVLVFSLAGYGVSVAGISARTMQGVSWALAILVFGLASSACLPGCRKLRVVILAGLASIVVLNAVCQEGVLKDWAAVWKVERRVLDRVPVSRMSGIPSDSRVLYLGPAYYRGMVILGADWDTTGAVYSVPALRSHWLNGSITPVHSAGEYDWRWDGSQLTQVEPGAWSLKYPAKHLFVWDFSKDEFREVAAGYHLDHEESRASVQVTPP